MSETLFCVGWEIVGALFSAAFFVIDCVTDEAVLARVPVAKRNASVS
jgi:hypothetical protein